MNIDRDEMARLTEEYGGQWGINHTRRLLRLIELIGTGRTYNTDALWVAAHLHDWGGYAPWKQAGVDHAARSREIAGPFLQERGYPADFIDLVLECIAYHHTCTPDRSLEAILLSDADALDFLGAVGVLRLFSKNALDLRGAYSAVKKRRAMLPDAIILDTSKTIAAERIKHMDDLLAAFEAETFGCF
jgi:uncharacterized protein